MGNGSVSRHGLVLCTDSYSITDIALLRSIVSPYFHNSMLYKLDLNYNISESIKPNYNTGVHVSESKSTSHKAGSVVSLIFSISQHSRDIQIMNLIMDYLQCGIVYAAKARDSVEFKINKFSDLSNVLFPFFLKFPLGGSKALELADFLKVAVLMQSKAHTSQEGLARIINIQNGMNKGRHMSTLVTAPKF